MNNQERPAYNPGQKTNPYNPDKGMPHWAVLVVENRAEHDFSPEYFNYSHRYQLREELMDLSRGYVTAWILEDALPDLAACKAAYEAYEEREISRCLGSGKYCYSHNPYNPD